MDRVRGWLGDPVAQRKFHGYATVVWFVLALPICILLANSLAFVVWVSVYAVVIGHFSAWQAASAEIASRDDIEDPRGNV